MNVSVQDILDNKICLGHRSNKRHPSMNKYISCKIKNTDIIDQEKVLFHISRSLYFIKQIVSSNKNILFVDCKHLPTNLIEMCKKNELPYINRRWLGGILTNWSVLYRSVRNLKKIELIISKKNKLEELSKKEQNNLYKKQKKLSLFFEGIKNLPSIPSAIFLTNYHESKIAIEEARKMKIPIISIVDTNCDIEKIDYPILGNDDSIKSINLILSTVFNCIEESKSLQQQNDKN